MRKIIQIAYSTSNTFDHNFGEVDYESGLMALCDDGSVWRLVIFDLPNKKGAEWMRVIDIPQDEGEPQEKASVLSLLDYSITKLNVSVRVMNCLHIEGIDNLFQLVNYQGCRIKRIQNLGKKSEKELYEALYDLLVKDKLMSIDQVRKLPIFSDYKGLKILSNKAVEYRGKI